MFKIKKEMDKKMEVSIKRILDKYDCSIDSKLCADLYIAGAIDALETIKK